MSQSHAAGWASDAPTPAQVKEMFAQIESGRITKERFQVFLRGEKKAFYAVTVDYDISLAEMIRRGAYDYANSDITEEHFPVEGEGEQKLTIEVVHFGSVMTSKQVINELGWLGLRPATLPEILALGASYPELQREFPIVALGSDWRGRSGCRYIPCLWGSGHRRSLNLYWFGDGWLRDYRFATVRTES